MKPATPTTEKRLRQIDRFLSNEEAMFVAAGLREDLSLQEKRQAMQLGRAGGFASAGAKRTAVHIPSEREAFEASWPLLAALT